MTPSGKCVIEVDIVPDYKICKANIFHTFNVPTARANKKAKGKETDKTETQPLKQCFVREGASSRDLLASPNSDEPTSDYNMVVNNVVQSSQLRELAEERHLIEIRNSPQGRRLIEMITGASPPSLSLRDCKSDCYCKLQYLQ